MRLNPKRALMGVTAAGVAVGGIVGAKLFMAEDRHALVMKFKKCCWLPQKYTFNFEFIM